jgi:hypothetical protein
VYDVPVTSAAPEWLRTTINNLARKRKREREIAMCVR